MTYKILIPQDISSPGKDYLIEKGYAIKMGTGYDEDTMIREIADCDGVIVRNFTFNRNVIQAAKRLKVIARHGVGYDNIDVKAATECGIRVTYAPFSNSLSVAEHVICFILSSAHNLVLCDTEMRKGNFEIRHTLNGSDVSGKTLGIIGFGRIGKLVAQKAKLGLDMRVIIFDPFVSSFDNFEYEYMDSLEKLLGISDFVTLHIPLNEKTKDYIGKRELELMKPSSCIINAARGGIVNEHDLLHALKDGVISFACLDVFEEEPVKKDNPLLSLKNSIVTPHSATLTAESLERMGLHAAQGIDEVLQGRKPTWAVN